MNYPRVNESDFDCVGIDKFSYKTYHTRANPIGSAAKKISSTIMFTLLLVLVFGSVALSLDESLLEARIVTIFSIIINSILDIGLTIWKFLGGYLDCERIVKTEDLRSTIDQNEILVRFKGTLTAEKVAEYESEVIKQEEEQKQLDAQVGEV